MALSRSKGWVRGASAGFLVAIPLLMLVATASVVVYWGFGLNRLGNDVLGQNFIVLWDQPPVAERRVYGLLAVLPALGFWLFAMQRLFVMFRNFYAGRTVGLETIRLLRSFALYSAIAVMAAFAFSGVMRWAAGQFDDAPLWTHLGFSATHAAVLFTAAIVFVASHIIEEGYEYKKETEEYV